MEVLESGEQNLFQWDRKLSELSEPVDSEALLYNTVRNASIAEVGCRKPGWVNEHWSGAGEENNFLVEGRATGFQLPSKSYPALSNLGLLGEAWLALVDEIQYP